VYSLLTHQRLASAEAVFFGRHGDVTHLARQRAVRRQTLYREAHAVARATEGSEAQQRVSQLRGEVGRLHQDLQNLRRLPAHAVLLGRDRQAEFVATAQAEGISLPATRRLLGCLLGAAAPSVATLGRWAQQAARRSTALLEVLDPVSRPLARQAAADELFAGRRPILVTVEPDSLCWLSGRLAGQRDGEQWAREFGQLPRLEQVVRDAGTGMEKGLQQVNRQRRQQGRPPVADQADHFHALREGTRALRRLQGAATRALERAEEAQRSVRGQGRRGRQTMGLATVAAKRWRAAERAVDRWSAQERAWGRVREALKLVTPTGEINTRPRAAAAVAEAAAELSGPEWAKVRRQLARPELFTFLDRVEQGLAALPVADEVRAAVCAEGLRRRPEVLAGGGRRAAILRGVLLAAGLVLSWAGAAGAEAVRWVRGVLAGAWRASSAVEGLNSVLRMHQGRHRKVTQGLLDLKRLYWNCRALRTGPRRKQAPYQRLGLKLPELRWWELLNLPPDELRRHLSALNPAT